MPNWIVKLRHELGMPYSLGELGVRDDQIPALSEKAPRDPNILTNPTPLNRGKVEKLLSRAINGKL